MAMTVYIYKDFSTFCYIRVEFLKIAKLALNENQNFSFFCLGIRTQEPIYCITRWVIPLSHSHKALSLFKTSLGTFPQFKHL